MAQHIRDDRVVPPNYFPNNDISALDAGSWNLNLPTKVVDRAGRAVPEEEQAPKDGHRRILAALDFTKQEHVVNVMRQAVATANPHDTVVLFNVLSDHDQKADNSARLRSDDRVAEMTELAKQFQEGVRVITHVVFGKPDESLLCALKQRTDLVILGKRKLRGVKKFTSTSVSNVIIEKADCSVLIAK